MPTATFSLNLCDQLFEHGPEMADYPFLNEFFIKKYERDPQAFLDEFQYIRQRIPAFHSTESIAGFCYQQPYGYAGDFQLIDRLYTHYKGPGKAISRWDDFAQSQPAAEAVRNRKAYFINLLQATRPGSVLDIASGPCRDIKEYYEQAPGSTTTIDCIELDGRAIQYARHLLQNDDRVKFVQQNVISYKPDQQYPLVWSAGLFDYFTDGIFVRILRKLLTCVQPGGELVIGNFAAGNPNKAFMEVGMNWFLHHRSPQQLIELARAAGAAGWALEVNKEPKGVNLFLHCKKAA